MARRRFRVRDKRKGTVAAITALLIPVVVGATAVALDGGLLYLQRRQAQSIADAASLAAAYTYFNTTNLTMAQLAAIAMAQQNGVTITSANVTMPQTGYLTVTLTTSRPRAFSALWGAGTMSATATATARGTTSTQPYSSASVIVLDPTSSGSLTVAGGGKLTTDSGVQVNSSSSTAVNVNNGAHVDSNLDIVGGYTCAAGSHIDGTIDTGCASVGDPLASLPTPTPPAPTSTPMSNYQGWGSYNLQPGLYTGDVNLGNGGTFTMAPGLYYIQGGSLNIANGCTLTGNGVTIYIDEGGGTINFEGGTKTTLTPPTSGTYAGVSYFQARNSTVPPNIANGSSINLSGTFYAAGVQLTFAGGSKTNQYGSQLVVKQMNLSNGCDVDIASASGRVATKTTTSVTIVR